VRCAVDDTAMTREWKSGVEEASKIGFRRWKSRKWDTWFVPHCVSNPSAVLPLGVWRTPALLIRMSSLFVLFLSSATQARTLARDERSRWRSSTDPGSRIEDRAAFPF